jgi:SpoVK/Ycf46/Vps4 family AAA+-type ATPase
MKIPFLEKLISQEQSKIDSQESINNHPCGVNLNDSGRLENKVKNNNSKINFKRIVLEHIFSDINYSAFKLWEGFKELGDITKINQTKSFNGEFIDLAIMKQNDDNIIYPVEAVYEVKFNNSIFIVEHKPTLSDTLKVKVECDVNNINLIQKIFEESRDKRLQITKVFDSNEEIIKTYGYLKDNASYLKILQNENSCNQKIIMNKKYGAIPINSTFNVILNETKYQFKFSSLAGYSYVEIKSPPEKANYIEELIDQVCLPTIKEGDVGVKTLEGTLSVKGYTWDSVGGLSTVKEELQEYIEWPLQNPDLFKHLNTSMPKGILLTGPPGNGKTTIAKILANVTNSEFYSVSSADINSKWVGESEKNIQRLFNEARKSVKKGKTAIIFIDEIDGLYTNRDEMDKYTRKTFGQFCSELEGISDLEGVVVIGATNKYDDLDAALVRPGRFSKRIEIPNPKYEERKEILEIYLTKKQISKNVSVDNLAERTNNYSGAMLKEACECATFNAIRKYSIKNNVQINNIKETEFKDIIITKEEFDDYFEKIEKSNIKE